MRKSDSTSSDVAVRSFRVNVAEDEISELKRRILTTRWPEKETVNDDTQGVRLALLQELANYWGNGYDFNRVASKLNALPQFITNIDSLDIHFVHVRSKRKNALQVIITHGWPGSIFWYMKVIEPLTDPTAYGGTEEDAFDVVIPSLPGFGFSGKPATTGWDPTRIARAWVELMKRLGYKRFVAQGGDWGAITTDAMALLASPELIGIHTNMAGAVPVNVSKAIASGGPTPDGLSDDKKSQFERLKHLYATRFFYAYEMGTRVQTLYGIADSPVGLAAWIIDNPGDGDTQPAAAMREAMFKPSGSNANELTRDDLLDNITLYWLTNTAISSGRIYWENKLPFFDAKGISLPVGVSVFPSELYQPPKSWAEQAYSNLIYYNKAEKGGHVPAWEHPDIFSRELRAAFKSLRRP